jgi:predicted DNA-binding protein YlxM (UPF0122 family)
MCTYLIMNKLRKKLRAAGLTDRQLTCLAMYYFDGLTMQDIAEGLELHKTTVSQHIRYGRKKLKSVGMTPTRVERDDTPRMVTMDTDAIDRLGPDDIVAAW